MVWGPAAMRLDRITDDGTPFDDPLGSESGALVADPAPARKKS